jgi:hypothetical protein
MTNLPSDSDGRRFTDREMKLIFERAGEADVAAQPEQGYSLAEMQEIALQVGLSPTEIAKAASTLRTPETSNPILGAPTRFHASRTHRAKLTEDGTADVALRIREATGLHGELRNVPRWHRVACAHRDWTVHCRLHGEGRRNSHRSHGCARRRGVAHGDRRRRRGAIAGLTGGYFIANALQAVGFGEVIVSAVAALGGASAAIRAVWPRVARRWAKKTDALMQSISEAAEQSTNDIDGDKRGG